MVRQTRLLGGIFALTLAAACGTAEESVRESSTQHDDARSITGIPLAQTAINPLDEGSGKPSSPDPSKWTANVAILEKSKTCTTPPAGIVCNAVFVGPNALLTAQHCDFTHNHPANKEIQICDVAGGKTALTIEQCFCTNYPGNCQDADFDMAICRATAPSGFEKVRVQEPTPGAVVFPSGLAKANFRVGFAQVVGPDVAGIKLKGASGYIETTESGGAVYVPEPEVTTKPLFSVFESLTRYVVGVTKADFFFTSLADSRASDLLAIAKQNGVTVCRDNSAEPACSP